MQTFHDITEPQYIPPRTVDQVRDALAHAKKYGSDRELALLMIRHGRLTDDARAYVILAYTP